MEWKNISSYKDGWSLFLLLKFYTDKKESNADVISLKKHLRRFTHLNTTAETILNDTGESYILKVPAPNRFTTLQAAKDWFKDRYKGTYGELVDFGSGNYWQMLWYKTFKTEHGFVIYAKYLRID